MTAKECPHGIRMALVAASAATAEAVTFPIDFGKTRMQLHAGRQTFSGALASAVRKEGIGGVYAGIQPAIVRHLVYSSLRISLYEDLRKRLTRHFSNSASSALAGLLGGGIAQAVASPADRLKVMLVHEGGRDGMVSLLQRILREEGVKGLYRGVVVNVQRAALVNLGELSTYDQAKKLILKRSGLDDGLAVHTLSAFCSGFVASICATPADVVKSRVMAGQAHGVVACVRKIVGEEGLWALWKGFFPNWGRLGPWQLAFWITYEHTRQAMGYGGF
ncbi:unnamed protein product [Durusdinium trenchii]|uniref:Uncharacterized protein n=1 Tax=Durusdinium trenchii TaxID=1381693 RepID=A0ABP0IJI2_9DINO